jgi:ATP-dependent Clp protease protease subunit
MLQTKYQIKNDANAQSAELWVIGAIASDNGWKWSEADISSVDVVKALQGLNGKALNVYINSGGGDAFEGLTIGNLLKAYGNVTTHNIGLVGSAATPIYAAGKKRKVAKNALFMVHNMGGGAWGSSEDLRKTADVMDLLQDQYSDIYADVMTGDRAENKKKAAEMMKAETWLTTSEMLEMGFATEVTNEIIDWTAQVSNSQYGKIQNNNGTIPQEFINKSNLEMSIFNKLFGTEQPATVVVNEVPVFDKQAAIDGLKAQGYEVVEPTEAEALTNNVNALKAAKSDSEAEIARLKNELATKVSRISELEGVVANQAKPSAQDNNGTPSAASLVYNGLAIPKDEFSKMFPNQ